MTKTDPQSTPLMRWYGSPLQLTLVPTVPAILFLSDWPIPYKPERKRHIKNRKVQCLGQDHNIRIQVMLLVWSLATTVYHLKIYFLNSGFRIRHFLRPLTKTCQKTTLPRLRQCYLESRFCYYCRSAMRAEKLTMQLYKLTKPLWLLCYPQPSTIFH